MSITREEQLVRTYSWYESIKDGKYERFNLECNKTAVFDFIESQLELIKPETVKAAFEAAAGNGNRLPNGFQLAVKADERLAAERAAKAQADAEAAAEKERLAAIEQDNRRFENIAFISQHRGATTPEALAVEKRIISHWPDERLEQEVAAIRLRQQSKGQTGAEFAKAQGLDKIDVRGEQVKKGTATVPLPESLTASSFRKLRPAEIRIMVSTIARQGFDDRAIWRAINQRVAETAGA
jgi:hypothetical protein